MDFRVDDADNLRQQVELLKVHLICENEHTHKFHTHIYIYTYIHVLVRHEGNNPVQSFQSQVAYTVYPRLQERMMEIEDTNIMPHPVLKADLMLPACEKGTIVSGSF